MMHHPRPLAESFSCAAEDDFIALPRETELSAEHRPELLGGVTVLRAAGRDDQQCRVDLTAVPYYAYLEFLTALRLPTVNSSRYAWRADRRPA